MMSPNVDGGCVLRDAIARDLPGSENMVGGSLKCMYHRVEPPLMLGRWACGSVYMHVAYKPTKVYDSVDCRAVHDAINEMVVDREVAADVLLRGSHADGHPLPGVYTVATSRHRVDFRVIERGNKHLWAEVIPVRS